MGEKRKAFQDWIVRWYGEIDPAVTILSWDWDDGYPIITHDHRDGEIHLDDEWNGWEAATERAAGICDGPFPENSGMDSFTCATLGREIRGGGEA